MRTSETCFVFFTELFYGDEELVVLFHPNLRAIAIVIPGSGGEGVETRHRIAVDDDGVLLVPDPYLMAGKDDIVRAVGMFDADGGFDGAVLIEGLALVFAGVGGSAPIDEIDDAQNGGDEDYYDDGSTAHGTTG